MSENEKIDELLTKIKSLSDRAKSTRAQFGSPLVDRLFDRVDKLSSRLPQGNGTHSQQLPQPQEAKISCPKCGVQAVQGAHFCSGCGFDFQAEQRRQQREDDERQKLERFSKMGVTS